jgi:hypothetical protein
LPSTSDVKTKLSAEINNLLHRENVLSDISPQQFIEKLLFFNRLLSQLCCQDAGEFFSWAIKSNMTGVQFIYASSEQTKAKHTELKSIKAKPLNQTMKLHAVGATDDSSKLMTRNMSCYCNICITL